MCTPIVFSSLTVELGRRDRNSRPHQQHSLFPLDHDHHRIDQHWLECSPKHHRCTLHRRHELQLRTQHRLHSGQASAKGASSARSLLSRQVWNCGQCVRDGLRDRFSCGFFLPSHGSNGCGEHELVFGHVRRSTDHRLRGLRGERQEALH